MTLAVAGDIYARQGGSMVGVYRRAVCSFCKACRYRSRLPGTWRQQVALCREVDCPLWHVRPKARALPEDLIAHYEANLGPYPTRLVCDLASLRTRAHGGVRVCIDGPEGESGGGTEGGPESEIGSSKSDALGADARRSEFAKNFAPEIGTKLHRSP